jgi:hypothetical protein
LFHFSHETFNLLGVDVYTSVSASVGKFFFLIYVFEILEETDKRSRRTELFYSERENETKYKKKVSEVFTKLFYILVDAKKKITAQYFSSLLPPFLKLKQPKPV